MVAAGGGDGGADEVGMLVDGRDEAGEDDEELQVVLGVGTRLQQVVAIGGDGPVVVLAGAVDVGEGLLGEQACEPVVAGQKLHLLHGEEVVVDGSRALLVDGRELVLAGRHLVVLGLCGDAQLPELVIELLHELVDGGADGAEVVLVELLALGRLAAEERASAEHEVGALLEVLLADEEVLLLGADAGEHAVGMAAEEGEQAFGLLLERHLAAQERRFLVERLARVGDERRGDAEHLVLDECGARGIPNGVAARLEGGTDAAGGEARRIGLALHELLAREGHEHAAIALGGDEAVVLLGGDAGEGLEPVREVGGAHLERPLLHGMGDLVGDVDVEGLAVVHDAPELLVGGFGQPLLHDCLREDETAVFRGHAICSHGCSFPRRTRFRNTPHNCCTNHASLQV